MDQVVRTFFFQAEDGIRDLVRSRGLGDVYKRQMLDWLGDRHGIPQLSEAAQLLDDAIDDAFTKREPVSYTHLTLPTSDLV